MTTRKSEPKLGEQIVDPLDAPPVVHDPTAPAEGHRQHGLDDPGEVVERTPSGLTIPKESGPDLSQPLVHDATADFVRLENGVLIAVIQRNQPPSRRLTGVDGKNYEHCATDPATGEWIYRHMI